MYKTASLLSAFVFAFLTCAPSAHADGKDDFNAAFANEAKLRAAGKLAEAAAAYEKALPWALKNYGENHEVTDAAFFALANLYEDQGKLDLAERFYRRSLKAREALFGNAGTKLADVLNNLAEVRFKQAKFADGEALFQRCIAISEKAYGNEHIIVAARLNNLSYFLLEQGKGAEAEPLCRRCCAIREKVLGKEHHKVADCLMNLAKAYANQGKCREAAGTYQHALAIFEKAFGKEHPRAAVVLDGLASLHSDQGMYADAEPLFQRCLTIQRKHFGNESEVVASTLANLANLYARQGKYAEAELSYLDVLRTFEKAHGKDNSRVAGVFHSLGILYTQQKKYAAAESLHLRSLAIREKTFGKEHLTVAASLTSLGVLYAEVRKYAAAEPLYLRALAIREQLRGKEHIDVAVTLNDLAGLNMAQGKFEEAEPRYNRCLAILLKDLGKEHPHIAAVRFNLVSLYLAQERFADVIQMETQLRQGARQFVLRELPSLSEREQQSFLAVEEKARFTQALAIGPRRSADAAVAAASAGWLVNGKAIALEAQTIRARLERETGDVEGKSLLGEIQSLRSREAALALQVGAARQPEALAQQRAELEARRRELEKKLAPRSGAAAKVAKPWLELAEVRRQIPSDGVLIDIARFRVSHTGPKGELLSRPEHYVAWVVPTAGAGNVQIVDLGDAATIDAALQAARATLESAPEALEKGHNEKKLEADAAAKLTAVAALVIEPLKPRLGKATKLIISPDGDLWLLPWAALPSGAGRYLIEDYSLRFVVSGRDLVDDAIVAKPAATASLILADPDYNLSPTEVANAAAKLSLSQDKAVAMVTRAASGGSRGVGRVKRLPGTAAEAQQASEKLRALTGREPKLYKEAEASETIVKATRSPQVLVLATHGFFLKKQEVELNEEPALIGVQKPLAVLKDKEGKEVENPLLRCGLLLAGANKRAQAKDGEDDGVLTGLEIVGLDLRGTQLVVLSACETGVGDVQTGEGVAGLRQAFQLAGAESVMATLWQISDQATVRLMNGFYDELAQGAERAEALARAQRQFLKERRESSAAAHPYFWASFTLTGK
jgi:CHAT domain-containing protein